MARQSRYAAIVAASLAILGVTPVEAQQKTVNLMAYAGVFQDLYDKAVVQPFMKANPDIKVNFIPVVFSGQMLGQLRAQKAAPQVDAVIMDIGVSKSATDEELFEKITEAEVPNIKDLHKLARHPRVAGVGVTFDNVVLLYDSQAIKEPPESWYVLGDKQYAGKVVIDAAPKLQGTSLTFILDWAAGGKDPVRNFDKGIEEMKKIAPGVQTWDPKPEPYILVMNGQAVLGVGYNARAQYFSDQSKGRMKVTVPKEGTVFQINSINLVKGAPNKDGALKFINYALGPQAQKDFAELMFYAPTNVNASVSPEALLRTVVSQMDRVISVDWVEYAKVRDKLDEAWRRQVIPLSQ